MVPSQSGPGLHYSQHNVEIGHNYAASLISIVIFGSELGSYWTVSLMQACPRNIGETFFLTKYFQMIQRTPKYEDFSWNSVYSKFWDWIIPVSAWWDVWWLPWWVGWSGLPPLEHNTTCSKSLGPINLVSDFYDLHKLTSPWYWDLEIIIYLRTQLSHDVSDNVDGVG